MMRNLIPAVALAATLLTTRATAQMPSPGEDQRTADGTMQEAGQEAGPDALAPADPGRPEGQRGKGCGRKRGEGAGKRGDKRMQRAKRAKRLAERKRAQRAQRAQREHKRGQRAQRERRRGQRGQRRPQRR